MSSDEKPDSQTAAAKRFRLWHVDARSEFVAVVAEADSYEEIRKVRRRADWRYQITRDGALIDDAGFPILRLPGEDLTANE